MRQKKCIFVFEILSHVKTYQIHIIETLKANLRAQLGTNIVNVFVFGSQVNGSATEFSDYDILIVLKAEYDWTYKDKIYEICYQTELSEAVFFDITVISEHELKNTMRGKQPFILNAIKNGITV
jgi:predicted nucleotidyltransferase